jgi:hypothetical protein
VLSAGTKQVDGKGGNYLTNKNPDEAAAVMRIRIGRPWMFPITLPMLTQLQIYLQLQIKHNLESSVNSNWPSMWHVGGVIWLSRPRLSTLEALQKEARYVRARLEGLLDLRWSETKELSWSLRNRSQP